MVRRIVSGHDSHPHSHAEFVRLHADLIRWAFDLPAHVVPIADDDGPCEYPGPSPDAEPVADSRRHPGGGEP